MKILDIQRDLEESLAGLATSTLPPALEGLRHLPVNDRHPQVSIRNLDRSRKVREDADASYFDPDRCEVVIRFVAVEGSHEDRKTGVNRIRSIRTEKPTCSISRRRQASSSMRSRELKASARSLG